jgi:hypothetical protein
MLCEPINTVVATDCSASVLGLLDAGAETSGTPRQRQSITSQKPWVLFQNIYFVIC